MHHYFILLIPALQKATFENVNRKLKPMWQYLFETVTLH